MISRLFLICLFIAGAYAFTCPPGSHLDGTACEPCPPGTTSDSFDATSCMPCGAGTEASDDQKGCIKNLPGTYSGLFGGTPVFSSLKSGHTALRLYSNFLHLSGGLSASSVVKALPVHKDWWKNITIEIVPPQNGQSMNDGYFSIRDAIQTNLYVCHDAATVVTWNAYDPVTATSTTKNRCTFRYLKSTPSSDSDTYKTVKSQNYFEIIAYSNSSLYLVADKTTGVLTCVANDAIGSKERYWVESMPPRGVVPTLVVNGLTQVDPVSLYRHTAVLNTEAVLSPINNLGYSIGPPNHVESGQQPIYRPVDLLISFINGTMKPVPALDGRKDSVSFQSSFNSSLYLKADMWEDYISSTDYTVYWGVPKHPSDASFKVMTGAVNGSSVLGLYTFRANSLLLHDEPGVLYANAIYHATSAPLVVKKVTVAASMADADKLASSFAFRHAADMLQHRPIPISLVADQTGTSMLSISADSGRLELSTNANRGKLHILPLTSDVSPLGVTNYQNATYFHLGVKHATSSAMLFACGASSQDNIAAHIVLTANPNYFPTATDPAVQGSCVWKFGKSLSGNRAALTIELATNGSLRLAAVNSSWVQLVRNDQSAYTSASARFTPVTALVGVTNPFSTLYSHADASLPCSPGTYSAGFGATACLNCAAGKSSGSGATSCTSCAAGSFSASSGSICSFCPAGTAQSAAGQTECTTCAAGTYSTPGSAACTECAAGFYQDTEGQGSCLPCPAGTYSSGTGASVCTPCAAGTFAAGTGNAVCTSCAVNTIAVAAGSGVCTACAANTFAEPGSAACSACSAADWKTASAAIRGQCFETLADEKAGFSDKAAGMWIGIGAAVLFGVMILGFLIYRYGGTCWAKMSGYGSPSDSSV